MPDSRTTTQINLEIMDKNLPQDRRRRLFTLAATDTSYIKLVPVVMMMAAGMALTIPSMTGSIMSSVPLGKAGVGSAMNDTTRELGGALGVAVLGSLVAGRYDSRLSPSLTSLSAPLRGKAQESLAGALQSAHEVGGTAGARVADGARSAYVSGMHLAAVIAASIAAVAALIVYHLLPSTNLHTVVQPVVEETTDSDSDFVVELGSA